MPTLFNTFFKSKEGDKARMSLAIAYKIITSHEGYINCISQKTDEFPDGYVEFLFRLPTHTPTASIRLPKHLPTNTNEFSAFNNQKKPVIEADQSAVLSIKAEVESKLKLVNRKLKILMIDDEPIYRNSILIHLKKLTGISEFIDLQMGESDADVPLTQIDGAILDVDLGKNSRDGFAIASHLRKLWPKSFLCIHSNRALADDNKRAIERGADAFLPKPMSAAFFVRFLAQVLDRIQIDKKIETVELKSQTNKAANSENANVSSQASPASESFAIALVDDSLLMRMSWTLKLKDENLMTFESPELFYEHCENNPMFLGNLKLLISDFYFDTKSKENGEIFAQKVKVMRHDLPIFLASDGDFNEEIKKLFHKLISKVAPEAVTLAAWKQEILAKSALT